MFNVQLHDIHHAIASGNFGNSLVPFPGLCYVFPWIEIEYASAHQIHLPVSKQLDVGATITVMID